MLTCQKVDRGIENILASREEEYVRLRAQHLGSEAGDSVRYVTDLAKEQYGSTGCLNSVWKSPNCHQDRKEKQTLQAV